MVQAKGLSRLFNLLCVSKKLSNGMSSNFPHKDLKRNPKMIMKDLLSSMGMSYTLMKPEVVSSMFVSVY